MQQINPIKTIWRRRLFIVTASLVCGIAAAAASLIFPNMYMASCKLIVMPRVFKTDLNIEPFNMQVYQELAESDLFKDRIAEEFSGEEGVDRKKLDTAMNVALTKMGPPREEKFAPILKLQVTMPSPKLAEKIANRWAQMFVKDSHKLVETESDATLEYVSSQYDQVEKQLQNLDWKISELRKGKTPEVLTEQIEAKRKQYGEVLSLVLDKRISYEGDAARLNKLSSILSQLQSDNGKWIGDASPGVAVKSAPGVWRNEAGSAVTQMTDQKKKINEHIKDSYTYRLNDEFNAKVARLNELETSLIEIRVETSVLEDQLKSYDTSLEGQQLSATLKKSMDTGDMFNALSNGGANSLKELSEVKVDTEVLNPVYTYLKQRRDEVNAELAGSRTRLVETESTVDSLKKEVDALKESLLDKNEELELLSDAQQVYSKISDNMSKEYVDLKSRVGTLREEVEIAKAVLEQLERQETELKDEINVLTGELLDYSVEINKLDRLRENAAETFKTLAGKRSEAELEKAKTTPMVKIAADAVPPVNKSSASRTLLTLMGLVLGAILGVAIVMIQAALADDAQAA